MIKCIFCYNNNKKDQMCIPSFACDVYTPRVKPTITRVVCSLDSITPLQSL